MLPTYKIGSQIRTVLAMLVSAAQEVAAAIHDVYEARAVCEALRRSHLARAAGQDRDDILLIQAAILLCRPR